MTRALLATAVLLAGCATPTLTTTEPSHTRVRLEADPLPDVRASNDESRPLTPAQGRPATAPASPTSLRPPTHVSRGTVRPHPSAVPTTAPPADVPLNWAALARCESGGNYQNRRSPTYRGAFQFSRATWASVGGTGDPADASPAEQDMRANNLYQRSGRAPWPYCGRFL